MELRAAEPTGTRMLWYAMLCMLWYAAQANALFNTLCIDESFFVTLLGTRIECRLATPVSLRASLARYEARS